MQIETYLVEHRAFSLETFGPGIRDAGIADHIRKELKEIEATPGDLEEWIDIIILAMDGFWRNNGRPSQIMPMLKAKLEKNKARQWPDWRTVPEGQAIEHIRTPEELNDKGLPREIEPSSYVADLILASVQSEPVGKVDAASDQVVAEPEVVSDTHSFD